MEPVFPDGLDEVSASYGSVYGEIKSAWTKKGGDFSWDITLPGNTSAIVRIPKKYNVTVGNLPGVRRVSATEGYMEVELFVHHIQNAESGAVVEFEKVLLVDNNGEVKVGVPTVEGAKVVCEVLSPLVKGDKVLIFHKKRRKGYRKLNGHRQQFTEVSVKEIVA